MREVYIYCSTWTRPFVTRLLDPACGGAERKATVRDLRKRIRTELAYLLRVCNMTTTASGNDRIRAAVRRQAIRHMRKLTALCDLFTNKSPAPKVPDPDGLRKAVLAILDHSASPALTDLAGLDAQDAASVPDGSSVPWDTLAAMATILQGCRRSYENKDLLGQCWFELAAHGRRTLLDTARSCRSGEDVDELTSRVRQYTGWGLPSLDDHATRDLRDAVEPLIEFCPPLSVFALLDAVQRMTSSGGGITGVTNGNAKAAGLHETGKNGHVITASRAGGRP